ncbi:peptidase S10, serine carboxypeptidase [Martensiomyces pterosporus]|nr:peptidase S10, serine carboxypeptidase [Martensiomyces pterosporus]
MRVYATGNPGSLARAAVLFSASLALFNCAGAAPAPAPSTKYTDDQVVGLPYKAGEQPLHESYSGHITVRQWTPAGAAKDSGSARLFYWYFPAIAPKVEDPPLILWIQGGPGSSSMIGLFTEMGPLELTDDGQFTRRNVTWANEYDFLVVDQPVGTGFSSVHPKVNLTLDDLYPMAHLLPSNASIWRAKYPGDVNQYSSIDSPMSAEYIVAEARSTMHEMTNPMHAWPHHIHPFLERFASTIGTRQSEVPGTSAFTRRMREHYFRNEAERPQQELDLLLVDDDDDLYLVNNGYPPSKGQGKPPSDRSVWEKIGLSTDESGDFANGYVTNMRAVGKDMWTFMQEFYNLRPELRRRDFHVFSESYGGKFVPAIAAYIDQENERLGRDHPQFINLKGVSIGNSWVHPPLQILAHGGIGFSWGLLDANQADIVDLLAFKALNHTLSGDLELGTQARLLMFDYFRNVTGGVNWYDIRQRNHQYKRTYLDKGLNQPAVRKALHSEDTAYDKDWGVYYHLTADIMRTTAPLFPYLLERYPVQLNQGQFDFRDGVAGNTLWLNELEWSARHKFALSDRQQWRIGKELAGYVRSGGNLSHWVILNAGHMSPGDQPEACLDMVHRIVS